MTVTACTVSADGSDAAGGGGLAAVGDDCAKAVPLELSATSDQDSHALERQALRESAFLPMTDVRAMFSSKAQARERQRVDHCRWAAA